MNKKEGVHLIGHLLILTHKISARLHGYQVLS